MIGVVVSTVVIGLTLNLMNTGLQEFHAAAQPWDINASHPGVSVQSDVKHLPPQIRVVAEDKTTTSHQASEYVVLNAIGSTELQDGKYLYSPATGQIEVHWIQGIGSAAAPAPQARLMATVINGILSRKLPWGLVLLGVSLVIAVELLGIRSLTFAVGAYLPIGTTLPIFVGGVVRWLVDRAAARAGEGGCGERYFVGVAVCFRTDCRGWNRRADRRGAEGCGSHVHGQPRHPQLPTRNISRSHVGVGAGVCDAGVFALLLRTKAAEEVDQGSGAEASKGASPRELSLSGGAAA